MYPVIRPLKLRPLQGQKQGMTSRNHLRRSGTHVYQLWRLGLSYPRPHGLANDDWPSERAWNRSLKDEIITLHYAKVREPACRGDWCLLLVTQRHDFVVVLNSLMESLLTRPCDGVHYIVRMPGRKNTNCPYTFPRFVLLPLHAESCNGTLESLTLRYGCNVNHLAGLKLLMCLNLLPEISQRELESFLQTPTHDGDLEKN